MADITAVNMIEEKHVEQEEETKATDNGANGEPPGEEQHNKAEDKTDQNRNENNVEKTKLECAIIKQIEYYFGDVNLRRDKFLVNQIGKDPNGWVPLSLLITFKRLAALTTDFDVIVKALSKSDEDLLEISDDKQKIRRRPERPIPEHNEECRKELQSRTVYAKGFPLNSTMENILEFFNDYKGVQNVAMRKYLDRVKNKHLFKGSVFITFATVEFAKAFIEIDKVSVGQRELLRKWQKDYLEMKLEERLTKRKKKNEKAKKVEAENIVLAKNAILYFENLPLGTTHDDVRKAFNGLNTGVTIAYVDFKLSLVDGFVRFAEENDAEKFLEKVPDRKVKLNDEATLNIRKATDEEEKAMLERAASFMAKRRQSSRLKRKRKAPQDNRNAKKNKV